MARIRSLKPNVTRDEAIEQFSRDRVLGPLQSAAFGPLRSVAEFYIPFHLFQVEVLNRGQREANRSNAAIANPSGSHQPHRHHGQRANFSDVGDQLRRDQLPRKTQHDDRGSVHASLHANHDFPY